MPKRKMLAMAALAAAGFATVSSPAAEAACRYCGVVAETVEGTGILPDPLEVELRRLNSRLQNLPIDETVGQEPVVTVPGVDRPRAPRLPGSDGPRLPVAGAPRLPAAPQLPVEIVIVGDGVRR